MARSTSPPPTLLAALALLPLSLLYLWPLPSDLRRLTPAEPDAALTIWHQIWLAWLLKAEDLSGLVGLHTGLVSAPAGVDLRYLQEWLTAALTAALGTPLGSLVAGQTLGFALTWSASGAAAFALGRLLGGRSGGALAAGAMLSAPFLRGAMVTALPEFLWFGLVAGVMVVALKDHRSAVRAGVIAGVMGALAGLATRYLALGAAGWLVVLGAGAAAAGRRRQATAAGVGLLVMAPALVFLGWPQLTAPAGAKSLFMALPSYPTPVALFWPASIYNPGLEMTWETHTSSVYVGWVLLAAGAVGAWRGGWRARTLFVGGLGFLVVAMGWRLPGGTTLPLSWLAAALPPLENLHAPSRFVLMAQLGFAGAAASALGEKARWGLAAAVVVEGVLAVSWLWPMPVVAIPEAPAVLADVDHGIVLDVSLGWEVPRLAHQHDAAVEIRQMAHGRPTVNMPGWPGGGAKDPTPPEHTQRLVLWLKTALPKQPDQIFELGLPPQLPTSVDWLIVEAPIQGWLFVCEISHANKTMHCASEKTAPHANP